MRYNHKGYFFFTYRIKYFPSGTCTDYTLPETICNEAETNGTNR